MRMIHYIAITVAFMATIVQCTHESSQNYVYSYDKNVHIITAYVSDTPVGNIRYEITPRVAGQISHLQVNPEYQRQGIGRALLQRAVDHLAQEGVSTIELISKSNARGFYERCGFHRMYDTGNAYQCTTVNTYYPHLRNTCSGILSGVLAGITAKIVYHKNWKTAWKVSLPLLVGAVTYPSACAFFDTFPQILRYILRFFSGNTGDNN